MRRLAPLLLLASLVAGCGSAPVKHAPDAGRVSARFAGIPQHGQALGSPNAPYTLVEFVDLQCPFSARFNRQVLPDVVRRFVRAGKLRVELRTVAFLGPDSATLAAAATAASTQNRMWQFADLAFRRQGRENSGYATPKFIGAIATGVAGLDMTRFQRTSGTPQLKADLLDAARAAHTAGITGTPAFRFGRTGDVLTPFGQGSTEWRGLAARIDAAIKRQPERS
jgi:protein-disulfide isomerase